jgi:hypothetical protein
MPKSPSPNPKASSTDLLLTREVAALLRFSCVDGALAHLRQHGLSPIVRGRAFLWRRSDIAALIDRKAVRS